MKPQTLIAQGAEAKIILDGNEVIKNRIKKSYRIPELDNRIRKRRTKKEIKLLTKASEIINSPKPLLQPIIKGSTKLKIPYIKGKKLSEHLNKFPLTKQKQILKQIGQDVAKLHSKDIIHGDLTTSNMILVEKLPAHSRSQINKNPINKKQKIQLSKSLSLNKSSAKKSGKADFVVINPRAKGECISFIDFGLGFISRKIEDKAVDIHLLRQALEAKHFKNWEILFKEFVNSYCSSKGGKEKGWAPESKKILERLKAVEKRGRYKH